MKYNNKHKIIQTLKYYQMKKQNNNYRKKKIIMKGQLLNYKNKYQNL